MRAGDACEPGTCESWGCVRAGDVQEPGMCESWGYVRLGMRESQDRCVRLSLPFSAISCASIIISKIKVFYKKKKMKKSLQIPILSL